MSTTRRTPRRRTSRAAPRKSRSSPARTHRPAAKTRANSRSAPPQARLPQIELTDGQRREGAGPVLVLVSPLLSLSTLFSPRPGLPRGRGVPPPPPALPRLPARTLPPPPPPPHPA